MTLEEILKITNLIENVDGEDVYVLEKEMYKEIEKLRQRINSEKGSYLFAMLNDDVDFICKREAVDFRYNGEFSPIHLLEKIDEVKG